MNAYVFPGQGAQFVGMGKELYETVPAAKELFETANDILGFRITDMMFNGTAEELKMTKVTQPAVFLHSVISYLVAKDVPAPAMVAGHSLGEFSALVACQTLNFADALLLVSQRAEAMQRACELTPSTMAVVLKFDDEKVEEICRNCPEIVVPANYNSPEQLVISGTLSGIEWATEQIKAAGARRVMQLAVGGAFHSPLMQTAKDELAKAIDETHFAQPLCPIYQNVTANASTDIAAIRENLKLQLTHPIRWTQTIRNMVTDGATEFVEFGPGDVLQGLIRKIALDVEVRHG